VDLLVFLLHPCRFAQLCGCDMNYLSDGEKSVRIRCSVLKLGQYRYAGSFNSHRMSVKEYQSAVSFSLFSKGSSPGEPVATVTAATIGLQPSPVDPAGHPDYTASALDPVGSSLFPWLPINIGVFAVYIPRFTGQGTICQGLLAV